MADSARFAEGKKRVIDGEANLDEFPPLHGNSRVPPKDASSSKASASSGGNSRVSPNGAVRDSSSKASADPGGDTAGSFNASSSRASTGGFHGDSRASEALHGTSEDAPSWWSLFSSEI